MSVGIFTLFAGTLAVGAGLAAIALWAPRTTWPRAGAVVLTAALVPLGYAALSELRARPKPIAHEWYKRNVDEATVLGVSFDEGRAIYLWLLLDDRRVPGYYALPWRPQIAEKLQNLIDEAMEDRTSVRIKNPFSRSGYDDLGDLNAYVVPPPTRPFKPPPTVPRVYNPRAGAI